MISCSGFPRWSSTRGGSDVPPPPAHAPATRRDPGGREARAEWGAARGTDARHDRRDRYGPGVGRRTTAERFRGEAVGAAVLARDRHRGYAARAPQPLPRTATMRVLLLASMFTLVACAHHRDATTVCPEYRGLRCITFAECSYDRARGCEVCRCASLE